jgi:hypothetical protein
MDHPAKQTRGHWSEVARSPEGGLRPLLSSPVMVRCREGRTAKPARRSPGLERRRDGWATTANQRRQRGSEVVMLELGEEGRRVGMGGVTPQPPRV